MKASQFFTSYDLYDGSVFDIQYLPDKKQLVLQIEMLKFDENDEWAEPERITGELIFSQVEDFEADSAHENFVIDGKTNGEILGAVHVPERDREGLEAVEFLLKWYDHQPHDTDILILRFLTADVQWKPDDPQPEP